MCFVDAYPDIVKADVSFLLGLNVLTQLKTHLGFDEDTISFKYDGWTLPLTQKLGLVYIVWKVSMLNTESELRKIHCHFHHPQPEKLSAVIKRTGPKSYSSSVLSDLEQIQQVCEVCQREVDGRHRFRVCPPYEDCIFSRSISMHLMKLDNRTLLHVVDKDTKFEAACFLEGESGSDVWEAVLIILVSPYIGYPDCISVDQGSQFQSVE